MIVARGRWRYDAERDEIVEDAPPPEPAPAETEDEKAAKDRARRQANPEGYL